MSSPNKGKLLFYPKNRKTPTSYLLKRGPTTIGSASTSSIRLKVCTEPVVCSINVATNGSASLENCANINEVLLLNGFRLKHGAVVMLSDGDKLEVPGALFKYANSDQKAVVNNSESKIPIAKGTIKALPKGRRSAMPNFQTMSSKTTACGSKIPVKQMTPSVRGLKRRSISLGGQKRSNLNKSEWVSTPEVSGVRQKSWSTAGKPSHSQGPSSRVSLRTALFNKPVQCLKPSKSEHKPESPPPVITLDVSPITDRGVKRPRESTNTVRVTKKARVINDNDRDVVPLRFDTSDCEDFNEYPESSLIEDNVTMNYILDGDSAEINNESAPTLIVIDGSLDSESNEEILALSSNQDCPSADIVLKPLEKSEEFKTTLEQSKSCEIDLDSSYISGVGRLLHSPKVLGNDLSDVEDEFNTSFPIGDQQNNALLIEEAKSFKTNLSDVSEVVESDLSVICVEGAAETTPEVSDTPKNDFDGVSRSGRLLKKTPKARQSCNDLINFSKIENDELGSSQYKLGEISPVKTPKEAICDISQSRRSLKTPQKEKSFITEEVPSLRLSSTNEPINISLTEQLHKTQKTDETVKQDFSDFWEGSDDVSSNSPTKNDENNASLVEGSRSPRNEIGGASEIVKIDFSAISLGVKAAVTPEVSNTPKNDFDGVSRSGRLLKKTPKARQSCCDSNNYSKIQNVEFGEVSFVKTPKDTMVNLSRSRRSLKTPQNEKSTESKEVSSPNLSSKQQTVDSSVEQLHETPKTDETVRKDVSDFWKDSPTENEQNSAPLAEALDSPKNDFSGASDIVEFDLSDMSEGVEVSDIHEEDSINLNSSGVTSEVASRISHLPESDLSEVSSSEKMLKTPQAQNSPCKDLINIQEIRNATSESLGSNCGDVPTLDTPIDVSSDKGLLETRQTAASDREEFSPFEEGLVHVSSVEKARKTTMTNTPTNDSSLRGVSRSGRLWKKTPKALESPVGIRRSTIGNVSRSSRRSIKTPQNQSSEVEDLSTVITSNSPRDVSPVRKLRKTSKAVRTSINVSGTARLLTPRAVKSPKNDLGNVSGVGRLLRTPRIVKSPKNDLRNVYGVQKLLKTPRVVKSPKNDLRDIKGVKKLLSSPKIIKSPKNDLTKIRGVKKMFATPKQRKSPRNDLRDVRGVKKVMKTPKEPLNDLSNVGNIKNLFNSTCHSPDNDLSRYVDDLSDVFDETKAEQPSVKRRRVRAQAILDLAVSSPVLRSSARNRKQLVVESPVDPPKVVRLTRGRKKTVEERDKENDVEEVEEKPKAVRGRRKVSVANAHPDEVQGSRPKRGEKRLAVVTETIDLTDDTQLDESKAKKGGRRKSGAKPKDVESLKAKSKRGKKKVEENKEAPTPKRGRKKVQVIEPSPTVIPSPPKKGRTKLLKRVDDLPSIDVLVQKNVQVDEKPKKTRKTTKKNEDLQIQCVEIRETRSTTRRNAKQ